MHGRCIQAQHRCCCPVGHSPAETMRGRERGVCFAIRGNIIILAPPPVIRERDLRYALDTMDRLPGELDWL